MRNIIQCRLILAASCLALLPLVTACSQSASMDIPAPYGLDPAAIPQVVSFSASKSEIHVETTLMLVSTRVLEKIAVLQKLNLHEKSPTTDAKTLALDAQACTDFLTALQHNQRTLANPQFNLTSGQGATFAATQSFNYAKSSKKIDPPAGSNAPPTIELHPELLTTGIWLDLTASIAPDQKSLLTHVHPTYTSLDGIDTFTTSTSPAAFVQVPKTTTFSFTTTATIPNGGTLLILGPSRTVESEVISHTFLTTNRSYIQDEGTLVLIVRPIIGPQTPPKPIAVTAKTGS